MDKCESVEDRITSKIRETTNSNCREEFARFGNGGCFLPVDFKNYMEPILKFEVREDDVWLASFMKTGTTWLKELVWLIVHDLDFKLASDKICYSRFPNLENSGTVNILKSKPPPGTVQAPSSIQLIQADQKSPRLIHTHLPWHLLPAAIQNGSRKPKVIYITRNPKDVAVSYFHHRVLFEGFLGTMDDFVELFINDAVRYAPFWNHVEAFWKRRHDPNILFLTYEQMKADLSLSAEMIAKFLGKSIDPLRKPDLMKYLSFEQMQKNPAVNHEPLMERFTNLHGIPKSSDFIRKGNINSWKEELSEEAKAKLERWYKHHCNKELHELWTRTGYSG